MTDMGGAWVWFVGGVLLSIAELVGGEFVLLALGGSALITAGVALLVPLLWVQVLVFAIASVALVLGARPPLLRSLHRNAGAATGIDALIGSEATVVSTVDAVGGQVKIGGEVWSALGMDGHRALPPGTSVTVVDVRGARAVVIFGA